MLVAKKSARPFTLVEPFTSLTHAVQIVHETTAIGVYEIIRGVSRGVSKMIDMGIVLLTNGLAQTRNSQPHSMESIHSKQDRTNATMRDSGSNHPLSCWNSTIDQSEAIINGLCGDYLAKQGNALDLRMGFMREGNPLPMHRGSMKNILPDATGKVCVFVHGLMCTERSWNIAAEKYYGDPSVNFGSQIKNDLGYTPLFVRYNTGRHISENGQTLSRLLTQLIDCYPIDLEEIILIGHSMGGLVSRSAAYYGDDSNASWVKRLTHIFCVGSPNLGAPMEKAANMAGSLLRTFNTAATQILGHVLNSRSAGIKDLRFGYTLDHEWMDKDPDAFFEDNRLNLPLVDGVGYYFIGASITADPDNPMGILIGDMLIRVPSAAGQSAELARRIPFHAGRVFGGMDHLHMANHPYVYNAIRDFLAPL